MLVYSVEMRQAKQPSCDLWNRCWKNNRKRIKMEDGCENYITFLTTPPSEKVIPFFKTSIKSSSISEKNTWNPVVGIPGIFFMSGSAQTEQYPVCRRLPVRLFSAPFFHNFLCFCEKWDVDILAVSVRRCPDSVDPVSMGIGFI